MLRLKLPIDCVSEGPEKGRRGEREKVSLSCPTTDRCPSRPVVIAGPRTAAHLENIPTDLIAFATKFPPVFLPVPKETDRLLCT